MKVSVALLIVVALMAIAVMPLHIVLAYPPANPTRILPDKVYRGETFNVTVTFSAPADNFQLVSLTDVAPAGWNVTVNGGWCTPPANVTKATGNKTELIWVGVYDEGTNFTALYKVTVPSDAEPGNYNFTGFLGYYLAYPGPYYEDITGGPQVEVVLRPEISFSPANLSFTAVESRANPANETLVIWNSGGETLNWTLSDDAAWLNEDPTSGSSTGPSDNTSVAVSVNITGMPAGNYTANITINATGASNTPQVVPVSLHISLPPEISFSPLNLSFSAVAGGANPENQTLEIWNSGGVTLNWSLSDDAGWLNEAPVNGNSTGEHDNVTVAVNITGMSAGNYTANITINATGANNTPQVVPVSLHISVPPLGISFSPTSLSFSAVAGGANPENQTLEIWNLGGETLNWTLSDGAAWLSEDPTSGSSTGEHDNVTVAVNITGMSAGDYSANITITAMGANNTPQVVPVSLHISVPPLGISFSPPSLSFSAVAGGANPGSKTLEIWNLGGGTINWSLSNDAGWLSEIPENGTSSGEHNNVTVAVDITGMSAGDYSANINITAMGANNTPQVVPVSLHISPPGGGGGGGGGGGSCYLDIDMLGKITRVKISCATGTTLKPAVALDFNNTNFLEIDRDTRVICDDVNKAPTVLVMRVANESPPVPDGSVIIGSVYNFTGNYTLSSCGNRNTPHCCSGVTFDQNITIVLNYDPNDLPESTASLAVAYYDTEQGSWVSLPTDVGRVAEIGKATGLISHASAVAIIAELAPTPPPASFVVSGLNIEQNPQVRENIFVAVTGENVTITGSVANNGGQEGTYIAELKLNGETVEAKEVTLGPGQSQQVRFTLSGMDYGQYEVEVAGLSGEFTVSRSIDWWSIFDIIAAVGLITWGAIWWRRRRMKPAQPTQSE
jgi:hypothetical protein